MIKRHFIAFTAAIAILLAGFMGNPSDARAGSGTVKMEIVKAALIVGVSGGSGTLNFDGNSYPISVGGLSAGWAITLSKANLSGKVQNINNPSDIAGIYVAAGAGLAVAGGGKAAVMTNDKGVTIELIGTQMGIDFSLNLEGLKISLK